MSRQQDKRPEAGRIMIVHGRRVALPPAPAVHKRFEAHALATPEAVAVVCGGEHLTYRELDARANRFANLLVSRGYGRGARIGVCLGYSIDLLVAILGALKAGATYVPLDPMYPPHRLRLLLGQVPDLALIVASPATAELVGSATVEIVDLEAQRNVLESSPATAPDVTVTGDDLCYAIFTSGSTGIPKLTAVRHEGWFNLLNWLQDEYGLHRGSNNLVVSAFGFDLSQRSLMTPLFCGATQYLIASRNFDPAMAYRMLERHDIRTVHCASSTLYVLVDWEKARGGTALTELDYLLFGGEPLHVERLRDLVGREAAGCVLLHQYGVAECTDVATSFDLAGYRPGEHEIAPVGRPAYNTGIHVFDQRMRGVGVGEYGEVGISGASVGAGYLNGVGPESARFTTVEVDGVPRRLYRTGDRGYVDEDGHLVVAGRMDAQVKVRGMRIDPTDVERALCRVAGVRQAAVVSRSTESGDTELVAFVVPEGDGFTGDELGTRLLETLPRSMVPAEFVSIPRIPLSPHGKSDRLALMDILRDRRKEHGDS